GALNYQQQQDFKKLLSAIREIKVLRERLFEGSRVIYEAETAAPGQELAKSVARGRFAPFKVDVDGAQDDRLALSVR
ncbi:MAG TPA: hypothetical protein PKC28_07095, partial [Bdellovibrionales bacterium]|nr:hypothetical protein [Bdellovibrionales bacterium]